MGHRLSPTADDDLDAIWLYTANRSGSVEIADRLIDSLTNRFSLLAQHPHLGRDRSADLRPGIRTFPVGEYVVLYRITEGDIQILRVLRGSRDITSLI